MTSQRASASSAAAREVCAFIAASSSGVTFRMRMRLEWKVICSSRSRRSAGISVSIVTLELGTIRPKRKRRGAMP